MIVRSKAEFMKATRNCVITELHLDKYVSEKDNIINTYSIFSNLDLNRMVCYLYSRRK